MINGLTFENFSSSCPHSLSAAALSFAGAESSQSSSEWSTSIVCESSLGKNEGGKQQVIVTNRAFGSSRLLSRHLSSGSSLEPSLKLLDPSVRPRWTTSYSTRQATAWNLPTRAT